MKILMVVNTLPPHDLSGVGEQVVQLAAGLRERGHEVRILGRGPDGVHGPKVLFPFSVVAAVRRAVRELGPDVVQLHESDGGLAARWLAWARTRLEPHPLLVALLQVSYVEERSAVRSLVHNGRVLGSPGAVERRFRRFKAPLQILLGRWTARRADLVLAPSEATCRELERDYAVAGVRGIPNVTGGLVVEAVPTDGLPPGGGELLFVGRLRIRKGVEVLLEALARGRESCTAPSRLLIAGDGEHRGALERHAGALGLGPETVRFLGRASAGEVRGLLARASALVVPSIYEGMPLVILEAMEAGIPVVASRVSGIPEVVVDGETGWLVPCEDPGALAGALAALERDPAEARRRGRAGRRRLDERFRPRHAAERWEELVEEAREVRR